MDRLWPIIDTHFHAGVNALIHVREDDINKWIEENDIDYQIVMQVNEGTMHKTPEWNPYIGNDWIARLQKMFPNRIIGLGGVYPWWQPPSRYLFPGSRFGQVFDRVTSNPCLEELERIILELGLWGLKMHPLEHHYQINNPQIMNPIFEKLTDLQSKCRRNLIVFVHAGGDSINNSPEAMADIAVQFPKLMFIAAHSGYKWAAPTVAHTMARLDNVMLDLTTMAAPQSMRECYETYGAMKFTAGSDGPFASVGVKNAIVRSLAKNRKEEELILGGNLAKYLGISWNKGS